MWITSLWPEWLSLSSADTASYFSYLMDFGYSVYLDHRNVAFENPRTYFFWIFILVSCLLFFLYNLNKLRTNVTKHILPDPTKPRFRKRDKVLFFGRKVLRQVRSSIQGTSKLYLLYQLIISLSAYSFIIVFQVV